MIKDSRYKFYYILGFITFIAFVIRLKLGFDMLDCPKVFAPLVETDMATYIRMSTDIVNGNWPQEFNYQPFYYSVFLPFLYLILGTGSKAVFIGQALVGALTVWFIGLTTRRLFSEKSAWYAAVMYALAQFPIFYIAFALIATLQAFWMILFCYFAVICWKHNKIWMWALYGIITSFAILTRGNALLLTPAIFALYTCKNYKLKWKMALPVIMIMACLYLPQLPFSLKNYSYHGSWVGPSSARDQVLVLGNTPEAPAIGLIYPPTYADWIAQRSDADNPSSAPKNILRWIMREPFAWGQLKFKMLLAFWHHREVPNNVSIEMEGKYCQWLKWPVFIPFGIICTLAITGICLGLKKEPDMYVIYFTIIVYCLSTVLFYILARFRLPLVPVLTVFAGFGLQEMFKAGMELIKKKKEFREALQPFYALGFAAFIVWFGVEAYGRTLEGPVTRFARPHGTFSPTFKRVLLYDHSSQNSGGWASMAMPEGSLLFAKQFSIPESIKENTEFSTLKVTIPLMGNVNCEAKVIATINKIKYTKKVSFTESKKDDYTEDAEFVVDNLPPGKFSGNIEVKVVVLSKDPGVIIDTSRYYGRTTLTQNNETFILPNGEAVVSLEWTKPDRD